MLTSFFPHLFFFLSLSESEMLTFIAHDFWRIC